MARILGISGSLRRQSFNTALLRNAAALMPAGSTLDIATLDGIPLYNGDDETANGIPAAVTALKEKIVAADALLLATPEYNNGIPGVMKNAIDWLSRPPADIPRLFNNRPVALIGASPGGFGTVLAQNAWLPVLRTLGTHQWNGSKLLVSRAHTLLDADGKLTDDAMGKQLAEFLRGYVAFIDAARTR